MISTKSGGCHIEPTDVNPGQLPPTTIPENRVTTNPEYTNTQQILPDYGIYLADS